MPLDADRLRQIFGETDEQPEAAAFIRADGIDLMLDRTLVCSGCQQSLVGLTFPPRVRSHWRREIIETLELWLRTRIEYCPSCDVEWSEPPYSG